MTEETLHRWLSEAQGRAPHDVRDSDDLAAFLLTRVGDLPPLPPTVQARLRSLSQPAVAPTFWSQPFQRRLALAISIALGVNIAFAGVRAWMMKRPSRQSTLSSSVNVTESPAPTGMPMPTAAIATPHSVPPPARAAHKHHNLSLVRAPVVVPNPPPPPVRSAQEDETSQIATALRQLRFERDPGSALATLRIYHLQYPQGTLAEEARLLEVDANLDVGRRAEALDLLSRAPSDGPRAGELSLLHAELLAEDDRCTEALPLFDRLAADPRLADPLQERTLLGRASCRARNGDPYGSRGDLETYLKTFPTGRFAAHARQALEGQEK